MTRTKVKNKRARETEQAVVNIICGFPLTAIPKMADHLDKRAAQERDLFGSCFKPPKRLRSPGQGILELLYLQDMMRQNAGLSWGLIRENLRELAETELLRCIPEGGLCFSWFAHEGSVYLTYVYHEDENGPTAFTFGLRRSELAKKLTRLHPDDTLAYLSFKTYSVLDTENPFRFVITRSELAAVESGEWKPLFADEEEFYGEEACPVQSDSIAG